MMLPCGHRAEDDGDRYYDDQCFEPDCGWMSDYRKARNAENAATIKRIAEERAAAETQRLAEEAAARLTREQALAPDQHADSLRESVLSPRGLTA